MKIARFVYESNEVAEDWYEEMRDENGLWSQFSEEMTIDKFVEQDGKTIRIVQIVPGARDSQLLIFYTEIQEFNMEG